MEQRFYVWVVGSVFIFLGLVVLSLGVKARVGQQDDDDPEAP